MQTDILNYEELPPERPVFLKVLCILTFIGSGWLIITNTTTYLTADSISQVFDSTKIKVQEDIKNQKNKNNKEDNVFGEKIVTNIFTMYTVENIKKSAFITLLGALFCLSGAILMWNLKKIGYVLYIIGTIIGIAGPFYIFGNNFIAVLTSGFTAFFGLLFVIFYAMNLKSMR